MTAGSQTDLLTGILNVQIRNEEKITEQDRRYCQRQQELLYKTLDQIDKWYAIFREDAERYREEKKFTYEDNGKISIRNFHFNYNEKEDYTHNEFKPFDIINELVDSNCNANANFANRIISYFNKTYNVAVPVPEIDGKTLRMGFRPVYETYVDAVIEHLGGKSFRETAEEELLARFLKTAQPSRWSKVKPELKNDRIILPNILRFDDFYIQHCQKYHLCYSYDGNLENICEGVAYGADDILNGSSKIIMGFDSHDVDISQWYNLTLSNAEQIKFYKNGRIDIRFKDGQTAGNCYRRLRLDEITLPED